MLNCTCKELQQNRRKLEWVKSKSKELGHFKVDPVLIINATFYKEG